MIKPDTWIKKMAEEFKMIEPFEPGQVKKGISFGTSSYGYDMRVSDEFKIFKGDGSSLMDPKQFREGDFENIKVSEFVILPAHSFCLARSVEYFKIPRNILTIAFGKSTYARCGVIVNITPFEPEWEGFVTLGISNIGPAPAKIYANEGIAQVLFLESNEVCETSYADRKGKYQAQSKITHAKI
jgi:dCTP deaminase